MYKLVNVIIFLFVVLFILSVFKYYLSNKNIQSTKLNRLNIDSILQEKINKLPVLANDTNNVIVFNDSLNDQMKDEKKRSFWDLLNK